MRGIMFLGKSRLRKSRGDLQAEAGRKGVKQRLVEDPRAGSR